MGISERRAGIERGKKMSTVSEKAKKISELNEELEQLKFITACDLCEIGIRRMLYTPFRDLILKRKCPENFKLSITRLAEMRIKEVEHELEQLVAKE